MFSMLRIWQDLKHTGFPIKGKINKKDTPITVIANRARHTQWLKESMDRSERVF